MAKRSQRERAQVKRSRYLDVCQVCPLIPHCRQKVAEEEGGDEEEAEKPKKKSRAKVCAFVQQHFVWSR